VVFCYISIVPDTQISFFKEKVPGSKVLEEIADNIYKRRQEQI